MTRKPIDPLRGHSQTAFNKRYREIQAARGMTPTVRSGELQARLNRERAAEKKAAKIRP